MREHEHRGVPVGQQQCSTRRSWPVLGRSPVRVARGHGGDFQGATDPRATTPAGPERSAIAERACGAGVGTTVANAWVLSSRCTVLPGQGVLRTLHRPTDRLTDQGVFSILRPLTSQNCAEEASDAVRCTRTRRGDVVDVDQPDQSARERKKDVTGMPMTPLIKRWIV
jgi:hypothetical protein